MNEAETEGGEVSKRRSELGERVLATVCCPGSSLTLSGALSCIRTTHQPRLLHHRRYV